eukprot:3778993-Rhodomonas_salina.1
MSMLNALTVRWAHSDLHAKPHTKTRNRIRVSTVCTRNACFFGFFHLISGCDRLDSLKRVRWVWGAGRPVRGPGQDSPAPYLDASLGAAQDWTTTNSRYCTTRACFSFGHS